MDIDETLLQEFVAEANEHLDSIEDDFLALERQQDPPDPKLVDKVFRAIHSVKGGAAFIGLGRTKELAHAMENLLSKMRSGEMLPDSTRIDALLKGVDLLNTMIAAPLQSEQVETGELLTLLKELLSGAVPAVKTPPLQEQRESPPPVVEHHAAAAEHTAPSPQPAAERHEAKTNKVSLRCRLSGELPQGSALQLTAEELDSLLAQELAAELEKTLPDIKLRGANILHLLMPLEGNDPPPLELLHEILDEVGLTLDATFVLPDNDFSLQVPPQGLAAEALLAGDQDPEFLGVALEAAVPGAQLTLVGRIEAETAKQPAPEPQPQQQQDVFQAGREVAVHEQQAPPSPDPQQTADNEEQANTAAFAQTEGAAPAGDAPAARGMERGGTVRINVGLLDKLMTLAGELVLVRNQQLLHTDRGDSLARDMVQRLDMVTSELQETIMQTRMQPIGNVLAKLPRIVRDLSNSLGKEIQIIMQGNEVELDKTILEALNDPLVHIIRNSCDHGVEAPEVREAAGKPRTGTITLQAYHEGGQIIIDIADDGQGIDPATVRHKALERGLRSEMELAQLSDREVLSLVMLPGFSTAKKVSEVSGRGVGMDVVRHAIENLGGNLELESFPGTGTTLHLRLPLTLAIIPCIIVMVAEQRFAIPQVNLEELVCLYDEEVFTRIEVAGKQEVYRLRNKLLPMVRLSEILANPAPFSRDVRAAIAEKYHLQHQRFLQQLQAAEQVSEEEAAQTLPQEPATVQHNVYTLLPEPQLQSAPPESLFFAVVKVGADRFGLIVDRILGTEEIVVKPMHPSLKQLRCYSGATVMGDGSVALILDIEGIARHAGVFVEQPSDDMLHKKGSSAGNVDKQSILLFRNGPNEQFALALPLIRRIEKIDMNRIETVGGKEFITIEGQSTLVLRLDKLLNVSPSQPQNEMFLILPKHIKRSFGILMSRILDIENTDIRLNTESYVEDGLLGTDVIRGHLTLFPDIYRLIELAEPSWFAERRQSLPPPQEGKRVLIVEDSSFLRHMLRRYLEADGYEVLDSEDGQQALNLLQEQDVDLVVSDIEMPVMDGLEFIRNLRYTGRQPDLPAMALTSLNTEDDKQRALKAGFDRYQVKLDRERFLADCTKLLTRGKD